MTAKINPEMIQEIIKLLEVGCYLDTAAAMVGIHKTTFNTWLRRGARELDRRFRYELDVEAKRGKRRKPTEKKLDLIEKQHHERLCEKEQIFVEFQQAVSKAMAISEVNDLQIIGDVAKGGQVIESRTRVNENGEEMTLERKTKPDWQAAAWRLERRNPNRWGRQRLDVHMDGEMELNVTSSDAKTKLLSALARMAGAEEEVGKSEDNGDDGSDDEGIE